MALKFKNAENLSWDVYLFSGTATQEKSTINQVAENRNLFCHSFGGKHLKLRCWKGHALSVGSRKGPFPFLSSAAGGCQACWAFFAL